MRSAFLRFTHFFHVIKLIYCLLRIKHVYEPTNKINITNNLKTDGAMGYNSHNAYEKTNFYVDGRLVDSCHNKY